MRFNVTSLTGYNDYYTALKFAFTLCKLDIAEDYAVDVDDVYREILLV